MVSGDQFSEGPQVEFILLLLLLLLLLLQDDQVGKIINQKLAYKYGLLNKTMPYYKYIPNTILENDTIKIYWDRSLITDKTIHNNGQT
jgi:hypothetical protein